MKTSVWCEHPPRFCISALHSSKKSFKPSLPSLGRTVKVEGVRDRKPRPGYRRNVGICLINSQGHVFAGRRCRDTKGYWQLPQGGIDGKESIRAAAERELREETGICSAKFVRFVDDWLSYDFHFTPGFQIPKELTKFKGQSQKWVLMQIEGEDCEVDLEAHSPQEFQEYRWMPFHEFLVVAQPFKRDIYTELQLEFFSSA